MIYQLMKICGNKNKFSRILDMMPGISFGNLVTILCSEYFVCLVDICLPSEIGVKMTQV